MPRNVLIIKLAAIGDVVISLPMVTAIRARAPDTRITWMCGRAVAPLVERVVGISEVIAVNEADILTGTPFARMSAVLRAWSRVVGRRFDTVYIAHSDARYQVLSWPLIVRHRRWLGSPGGQRGIIPGRSHADEYVRLVTEQDDHSATLFPPPALEMSIPETIDRQLRQFNPGGRPLVALTPGGARNVARENPLRRWPVARYAKLAEALNGLGFAVIITGDANDAWVRPSFAASSVLDLVGATDLPTLAAVLHRCKVVIAHDSGPLHLARFVGTPVVALLGPTPPTMFFRPEPKTVALWPGSALPCAPCYDGFEFAKCDNNVCMQMIDVQAVIDRVVSLARL